MLLFSPGTHVMVYPFPLFPPPLTLSLGLTFHVLQAPLMPISYIPHSTYLTTDPLYDALFLRPSIFRAYWLVCSIHLIFPTYSYSESTIERLLMCPWNFNWLLWPIQNIYQVKNIFDALDLINLSSMAPLAFTWALSTVVAKYFSSYPWSTHMGGFTSQLSLWCTLGEQILVLASYLSLSLLLCLGTLSLSVVLGVCSWKQYNLEPLTTLYSES